ncbi:MAG: AarF/ABC1/UbiB kinase family protein [Gammaproteobacteria bacterium]|nr:AarF/ABC1/UbiB kinase family protein [Gammaproteobacteria bacterium]
MASERRVTSSRLGRLSQLGRLAGGVAGGAIAEGARQLARGQRPSVEDMLLTPANARRLGDRLSEMRGAAMKVGQLLSMDSGHLLPPQLSELLARLREGAHAMPLGQVAAVLKEAWGDGWDKRFSRFSFTPLAAASIGQVHEAVLKDGTHLAVKIQYPDIRRSIDSDVDNVATLLRLSNLVPEGMDLGPLLKEAKVQLHAEADYLHEARALERFGAHLAEDTRFEVPSVIDTLTTQQVLTMRFLDGSPIESLADAPSAQRNAAATALLELAIREVFDWGLVQTDPNFANYLYSTYSGKIQLLDFGATRDYPDQTQTALRRLLHACVDGSDSDIEAAAADVGYLEPADPEGYRSIVVTLLRTATEPARASGDFDFARSDLAGRMKDIVVEMRLNEKFARVPPPEILFLHRKLGGLYLLLSRLRARIPVAAVISPAVPTSPEYGVAGELQRAV